MACLFCEIVRKEAPAEIVYEDDEFLAFKDIYPKAEFHVLIVPKKHIASINDLEDEDRELIGKLILIAKKVAGSNPECTPGYKLVFNVGKGGGQIVEHIHLHLLSGKDIKLP